MNPQQIIFEIKNGEKFNLEFRHTKILSVSDQKVLTEYENASTAKLAYKPQFPNGILSLDFSSFYKIQSLGLFNGLNNGFDFIIHPRMWIPYVYNNIKDSANPLYSLQYKVNQLGFDTICINCHKYEMWVEIYCSSKQGERDIVLSDLYMYY